MRIEETIKSEFEALIRSQLSGIQYGSYSAYSRGMLRGLLLAFCALKFSEPVTEELKKELQFFGEEVCKRLS